MADTVWVWVLKALLCSKCCSCSLKTLGRLCCDSASLFRGFNFQNYVYNSIKKGLVTQQSSEFSKTAAKCKFLKCKRNIFQ